MHVLLIEYVHRCPEGYVPIQHEVPYYNLMDILHYYDTYILYVWLTYSNTQCHILSM